ncbi:MAG: hypothetical protein JWL69_4079 [Phycisphaerales bacterium]|nr:hypothetical protein [Phycisphaerales bacterium]MDB5355127.1 hypothetical protein [Phycisphaerales bacterium]
MNLVTANLAWPALLLIYLPRYFSTYEPGHSRVLTDKPKAAPAVLVRIGRFFDSASGNLFQYIALAVSAICSGSLSFTGGRHETFDVSRIWLAVTLLLLARRLYADVRASRSTQ